MVETEILEGLLRTNGILKFFVPLRRSILGYYYSDGEYKIILINELIKNDERHYRSVLAEEIGHHMLTIGNMTKKSGDTYRKKLPVDKQEEMTAKWATDLLIPTSSLIDFIKRRKRVSSDEIAEYFMITNDFLLKKFKSMSLGKKSWRIDSRRYLRLNDLRSICFSDQLKKEIPIKDEFYDLAERKRVSKKMR